MIQQFYFVINHIACVLNYLRSNIASGTEVTHIGFVLEHHYSLATLKPSQLKGRDRNLYNLFAKTSTLTLELTPIYVEITGRIHYNFGSNLEG